LTLGPPDVIMSNGGSILSDLSVVAQRRLARGWSQAHLAGVSGVSRTGISAIEIGRLVPSVAIALRLAAALGESVETLFGQAKAAASLAWAWAPRDPDDRRVWRASVNGRLVTYPVESTAAGAIAHDALADSHGIDIVGTDARPDRTLVVAGCDPTVGLLVQELAARHGLRVLPLLRSSTQALTLLRQGLVHVAGMHLSDASGRSANDQAVRLTLGAGYQLVHQLRWDIGVAVDGHRRERSLRALLRAPVRWVNREEGSAARRTFDALLGSRRRPQGYQYVVHDHRAVATTISSGWAEAGVCVRPAAAEAQLGFLPLQQEAYELCVAETTLDDPRVAALMTVLRSVQYRRLIGEVPGCLSTATGEQRSVA
jgi:molybdate-binding protein/transcriptional regulator with XRE-family HTH domain